MQTYVRRIKSTTYNLHPFGLCNRQKQATVCVAGGGGATVVRCEVSETGNKQKAATSSMQVFIMHTVSSFVRMG